MGSTTALPNDFKIGILVPSSNTALEPLTISMLSCYDRYNPSKSPSLPSISVHFSRLPVTQISLKPEALSQFTGTSADSGMKTSPLLAAAKLLADANVDVIGWSGTSAGWLGFESDEQLCKLIESETGVKATTSTLALNKILALLGFESGKKASLGFVTPYLDDVQRRIEEVYLREANWEIISSNLGVSKNWDIAAVDQPTLERQLGDVVKQLKAKSGGGKPTVVSTFCTNLKAAHLAEKWEKEYEADGLIVLDTVTTVIWECLQIIGRPKGEIKGWGRLFEL